MCYLKTGFIVVELVQDMSVKTFMDKTFSGTFLNFSVPNAEFSSVVHGTAENLINKLEANLTSACHGDVITDPVTLDPATF